VTALAGTHPLNDSNYPQYPGTVVISVNGSPICTVSGDHVQEGVPVACNYIPTSDGSVSVTATVTDSVLYQSSAGPISMNTKATTSGGGGGGNNH
jgi:hypothetical protein